MADFACLSACGIDIVLDAYHTMDQDRCLHAEEETTAVVLIQSCTRRHLVRTDYLKKLHACREWQRVYRGHVGRMEMNHRRRVRRVNEEQAVFEYYASAIQHVFRGYHSRRFKHDFFARKKYIESILQKSNSLRQQLSLNREKNAQEEQERKMRETQIQFRQVAETLHHLVSTKACPGVYNSPYAIQGPPTAFGEPVESHLKVCTSEFLRKHGLKPSTVKRPRIKSSLQAQSDYEAVAKEARMKSRHSKIRRISDKAFFAGGKMKSNTNFNSVSVGTEYLETWRVNQSSRDKFPTLFHSAVRKNRLFDEIADDLCT